LFVLKTRYNGNDVLPCLMRVLFRCKLVVLV
jgi:hypothetical protein